MAISVTPDLTDVSMCEATTGWAGGISQLSLDTGIFIQGNASLSAWINNTTSADEYYQLPASVDMESLGSHVYLWMLCTGVVDIQANGGYRICLYTDLSNYATFYVGGNDTHGAGWQILCCNATATPDLETGTFDPSDVNYVGIQFKTITAALQKGKEYLNNCFWDAVRYGTGLSITSGASDAIGLEEIFAEDDDSTYKYGVIEKKSGVYYVYGTLTFGDNSGTDSVDFIDLNQLTVFKESPYLASDFQGITVLGNATGDTNVIFGDKVGTAGIGGNFTKSVASGVNDSIAPFSVEASDTDIDILKLYGSTFVNADVINLLPTASGREVIGCSFTTCNMISPNTITFTDSFIIGTTDTYGLAITNTSHNVSNCTFIDNNYAILVSGGVGEYDFDQLYFTNSITKDMYVAVPSGTVTVNVLNGGDTPSYNSAGATVVINNAVNLTLHIIDEVGNDIENAQVAIYKTSDDTELMNEDSNSSGIATETFNFVSETAIYWKVRKSSTGATRYFPRNGTGTITSVGFTATITLTEDTIVE